MNLVKKGYKILANGGKSWIIDDYATLLQFNHVCFAYRACLHLAENIS
jgi:hypothetical protein